MPPQNDTQLNLFEEQEQLLDRLTDEVLKECDRLGIDRRYLLLRLEFERLKTLLDGSPKPFREQFVVWIIERYINNNS